MLTLGYYNPVSQQYQNPEVYQAIIDAIDFMETAKNITGAIPPAIGGIGKSVRHNSSMIL